MSSDKIMERVRLLLARAEHPNTPAPEAELALQQANKLMVKHAIDEAILAQGQTKAERQTPERKDIKVGYDSAGEFWPQMGTILSAVAEANRCKVVHAEFYTYSLFGFREDLSWTEMLYTMILTDFVQQVNPRWNSDKSLEENVYAFKVAGYKWADINKIAMQNGHPSYENLKKVQVWTGYNRETNSGVWEERLVPSGYFHKLKRLYTKHAKAVGDEHLVKTTSFQQYREQFTDAYKERIAQRLHIMSRDSEQVVKETSGAELALVDRSHRVDEKMWEDFPDLHPEERKRRMQESRERQERALREREEMLNNMTPAARRKFLEKEERDRRRSYKRGVRYVAYQSAAANRGRSAANAVDLSRKRHTDGAAKKGELR